MRAVVIALLVAGCGSGGSDLLGPYQGLPTPDASVEDAVYDDGGLVEDSSTVVVVLHSDAGGRDAAPDGTDAGAPVFFDAAEAGMDPVDAWVYEAAALVDAWVAPVVEAGIADSTPPVDSGFDSWVADTSVPPTVDAFVPYEINDGAVHVEVEEEDGAVEYCAFYPEMVPNSGDTACVFHTGSTEYTVDGSSYYWVCCPVITPGGVL